MFSLTRSNLLRQLPGLNENIRRLTANCYRKQFNRNIFMKIAITGAKIQFSGDIGCII